MIFCIKQKDFKNISFSLSLRLKLPFFFLKTTESVNFAFTSVLLLLYWLFLWLNGVLLIHVGFGALLWFGSNRLRLGSFAVDLLKLLLWSLLLNWWGLGLGLNDYSCLFLLLGGLMSIVFLTEWLHVLLGNVFLAFGFVNDDLFLQFDWNSFFYFGFNRMSFQIILIGISMLLLFLFFLTRSLMMLVLTMNLGNGMDFFLMMSLQLFSFQSFRCDLVLLVFLSQTSGWILKGFCDKLRKRLLQRFFCIVFLLSIDLGVMLMGIEMISQFNRFVFRMSTWLLFLMLKGRVMLMALSDFRYQLGHNPWLFFVNIGPYDLQRLNMARLLFGCLSNC